ncbi:xanthine dehydrogenase family protein molybdopterin-binding subunit [Alicyclobacillus fastidiosus]|uniref:Xanthine dehydrogenase family protein molybdopterin-binding subunit n=1 Tax=Alicyclobacillus fastidiosus TaxID=392011 RepID=A0ABV5ABR6_9BACL|nr:xanthine dehydrogenase family protein molybdopterin-binding subunit [Alicyclobacillus fastidiosus]WEH10323.1 xanthine dehydrogenase family protein molybdopterin-binding subunit [Alicyclobacillus fastidiosus]
MSRLLTKPRFTGARVTRMEDDRLLKGQGRYLDDITVPGMLEIAFVRSNRSAAKLVEVDVEAARNLPGVIAVLTAEDCPYVLHDEKYQVDQSVLAKDEVRFVGEPIVAIVAENRYIAEDATELVRVQYDALPPVLTAKDALGDTRRVHSQRPNVFEHWEQVTDGFEDAFNAAPHRAQATFVTHRQTGVPMETRGCAAMVDPASGRLTVYVSHQSVHQFRTDLIKVMNLDEHQVRVVVPEVGGAFGIKAMFYTEYIVVTHAAKTLGRPVKWIGDRTESLLADCHARDNIHEVEVAFDDDGVICAVRDNVIGDTGAYPILGFPGAVGEAGWATGHLTGPYKIPHVSITVDCVFSNKTPVGAYRGVGGPVGAQVQEGYIDLVARKLGKDPIEVRRVNLIQKDQFPFVSATGNTYDPGSYAESMEEALRLIGYDTFRDEQVEARKQGRYLGIGVCVFVEPSAGVSSEAGSIPYEAVTLRLEPSGKITASTGLGPSGQGHETTLAQLIADELSVDVGDIVVLHGDTDSAPFGGGTGGSRSATIGGGAALKAAREMRGKLAKIAAHLLEASEEDIEFQDGQAHVAGVPSRGHSIAQLARIAYTDVSKLPDDMQPGLEVVSRYRPPMSVTYSNGTHAVKVEVDVQTGLVKILDYVAVNDCGVLINPMIVEGQIHGGVAQGIGSTFLEELRYDDAGQLTTTSLAEYLLPAMTDVPRMRIEHLVTPSGNDGGFKGMGEGSLIAGPPSLCSAVSNALEPFGVFVTEIPILPQHIIAWTKDKVAVEA